ncbi:MAG: BMP family ABC transporter substrate-binding protein [Anaerolineae bacterium]|nr:BMP family ABC transporter substrate-binding protein [Anaerolineae bacterium]
MVLVAVMLLASVTLTVGCAKPEAQPAPAPQAPPPAPKMKVGIVFDVGGRGDLSFNDMAYAGLEKAGKEWPDKIETKYLEPTAGGENREELLRLLAEEGYDLVIGVGFLFTDHIKKVSQEFPKVKFGLIDGVIEGLTEASNVRCLVFKEHEGSFLVGAAAALKTKANKLGFVGGMKIPLIERFEAGYVAGVKYVNPNAQVFVDYIGTTGEAFKDPVRGKELALAQFNKGADIVYHASGASGIGVIEAAAQQNLLAIGVDADQSLTAKEDQRDNILTSMLKRVDVAVYDTIKSVVQGTFKGGIGVFGLAEDGVGYAVNDYNKAMIQDITAKLDEIKAKVVSGEIKVPTSNAELSEFLKSIGK